MITDSCIAASPAGVVENVERAAAAVARARSRLGSREGTGAGEPFADGQTIALLKVAVGFPNLSDLELIDILEARIRRASDRVTRGCGGCHAYCSGE